MKGLTDIPGIRVGHASDLDGLTGCTAIICEAGAVAGVSVAGFASGGEEIDVLNPSHISPGIHAVCLAGGSAFGLEAASGIRYYLETKGVGFSFGRAKIPLVTGAILFDLGIGKASARPTREMGAAAAAAATAEAVQEGCVGAGTGATVGKALGMKNALKSGIGSFTVSLSGNVRVSALAAVNAFGDVIDPATGKIVAGARTTSDGFEFANAAELVKKRQARGGAGENTTLVVVATNARLTKVEAAKLAQLAQHGMVRSISPVHTNFDGDIAFALSTGSESADFTALGVAAAEAVTASILRAVRFARSLGGVPAVHR
jgi:L-aminopeptidase/D-esterase-like protein